MVDARYFETDYVAELNGYPYFVLADEKGNRGWKFGTAPAQDVPPKDDSLPLGTFHEGAGFSYGNLPSVYEGVLDNGLLGGAWDASTPGRLSTWARHGVGTAVTAAVSKFGFLVQLGNSLYMSRERFLVKYTPNNTPGSTWAKSGVDKDLGALNFVPGRPEEWNGKLYQPVAVLSSLAETTAIEVTQGTPDTYANLPANKTAWAFRKWKNLLTRASGNGIATVATTPTVAANWSDDGGVGTYQAGNPNNRVTDLASWDQYLLAGKSDGLWSFDDILYARNELPTLSDVVDTRNGVGVSSFFDTLLCPNASGLVRWNPQHWKFIGPEQEGGLEGDITTGFGRCVFTIPYGKMAFAIYQDTVNQKSSIVMLQPTRGQREPIPHVMTTISGGYFEGGCIFRETTAGTLYLAIIKTSVDGLSAQPWIWRLPVAGQSVPNDGSVPRAVSDARFYTPRYTSPGRQIQKTYRTLEFWLELSSAAALSATPGVQVWARVDDGAAFQLLDSTGAVATIKTEGFQRLWFPTTSAAVGHYVQYEWRIPALGGGESAVAIDALRDGVMRFSYRPYVSEQEKVTLVLTKGETDARYGMLRTVHAQLSDLTALAGPNSAPVSYKDPWGRTGFVTVESVEFQEIVTKGQTDEPSYLAIVTLHKQAYS